MSARKVAIFGTTPSRMEGPIQDNSGWERWTIGPGGSELHGWERLYEVHSWWPEDFKGYLDFLSRQEAPREIWTMAPMPSLMSAWRFQHKKSDEDFSRAITGDPAWPRNRVIPRADLESKFGRTWMSSSISWLFAQAIAEGVTEIGLWGIDLEAGEEYTAQFYGCRFFIDLARNIGINVHLPVGCGLMREPNPYPDRYETHFALATQRKIEWLRNAIGTMEREYEKTRDEVHRIEGRLLTLREMTAPPDLIQQNENALMEANGKLGNVAANVNTLKGELGSTEYWRRMFVFEPRDPDTPLFQ